MKMCSMYFVTFIQLILMVITFYNSFLLSTSNGKNVDDYLSPPKIIRKYGYPAEVHIIETEDGYLLEYHRIPHGKNLAKATKNFPIILHHGLFATTNDWIVNGVGQALAYRLSDEGYDVWLASTRGDTYAASHISLFPEDKNFWNFSFDEAGRYDISAAVDYILHLTKKEKIVFVGHSLGNTMFYVFITTRPEYSNKILAVFSLAPAASSPSPNIPNILKTVFNVPDILRYGFQPIFDQLKFTSGVFTYHSLVSTLLRFFCRSPITGDACISLLYNVIFGANQPQFNKTVFNSYIAKEVSGTSTKTILHCAQLITGKGRFARYDYGTLGNLKAYNSELPPEYAVDRITVPIRIYYGLNDIITDPKSVQLLYRKIGTPMGLVQIADDKWTHLNFVMAKQMNYYLLDELILYIGNLTSNNSEKFIKTQVETALHERDQHKDNLMNSDSLPNKLINGVIGGLLG